MWPDAFPLARSLRQPCREIFPTGIKRRCAVLALPAEISMKPCRRSTSAQVNRNSSSERTPAKAWRAMQVATFGIAAWRILRSSAALKTSMSV